MNTAQEIVLVTGSGGFIGSAVTERFAERFAVVGLDREGMPCPPAAAECFDVDLRSDDSVASALRQVRARFGQRIASVIHLAAYYDFTGEPSPLYDEITVQGTGRLLRELRKNFAAEQFVFSSTMLVHAPCEPGQRIREDSPLDPKWDYPRSKVQTEELIRAEHGDIPCVLLRIAGVYDNTCHSIPLANQIQRIYERRMTGKVYPGDVARGQAFIHLDDLVDLFWRAALRRAELPQELTLLVGEPETLSYDELQRTFGRLIHDGEEWETQQIPKVLAKAGAWIQDILPGDEAFIKPWMIDLADDHYELDIGRARKLLGWEPRHRLREALPHMVAHLKTDPLAWYHQNKLKPPGKLEAAAAR